MLQILKLESFPIFWPTKDDALKPWGLFFQDNSTPQMEGLEELHNNIMFYLAIVLFAVSWIMLNIIYKYVNHGTLVEFGLNLLALIIVSVLFMNISELLNPTPAPAAAGAAAAAAAGAAAPHLLVDLNYEGTGVPQEYILFSSDSTIDLKQYLDLGNANYREVTWLDHRCIVIPRSHYYYYNGELRYPIPEGMTWKGANNPFVKETLHGRILAKSAFFSPKGGYGRSDF